MTWTARREFLGQIEFGPIVLIDAQGLIYDSDKATDEGELAGQRICVSTNPSHQRAIRHFLHALTPEPVIVVIDDRDAPRAWRQADCVAWSSDLTILSLASSATNRIGRRIFGLEPLAPLLKADDPAFSRLVRWLFNGLIAAGHDDHLEFDDELERDLNFASDGWNKVLASVGNLREIEQRHFGPEGRLPLPWPEGERWGRQALRAPQSPALR